MAVVESRNLVGRDDSERKKLDRASKGIKNKRPTWKFPWKDEDLGVNVDSDRALRGYHNRASALRPLTSQRPPRAKIPNDSVRTPTVRQGRAPSVLEIGLGSASNTPRRAKAHCQVPARRPCSQADYPLNKVQKTYQRAPFDQLRARSSLSVCIHGRRRGGEPAYTWHGGRGNHDTQHRAWALTTRGLRRRTRACDAVTNQPTFQARAEPETNQASGKEVGRMLRVRVGSMQSPESCAERERGGTAATTKAGCENDVGQIRGKGGSY
ncbi:hypothetical protein B0H11DRAFT_2203577 [Mycena galericulata]|nr:hypothetical protein B0H11DRAFT_2203577 [Mycena galericulata]